MVAVGGLLNLYTLRAAAHRRPVRTVVGTLASVLLMVVFFHRMAELYETTVRPGEGPS